MNQKSIFLITTIACAIWIVSKFINVYQYTLVGAIFEFFWLFLIAGIPALAIIAVINWKKEKFNKKSLYPVSLLLIAITVVVTALT